jgi:phosphoribosylamine--glycine ligase
LASDADSLEWTKVLVMKSLIVGSGGREHAIAWAMRRANSDLRIYCAPGNAGIAEVAECVPIGVSEQGALVQFAASEKIDITVVGPEVPLAEGLVDEFEARQLGVFGPSRAASRLEASKSFAKQFMARHGIPTAHFRVAVEPEEAIAVLRRGEFGPADSRVVVKADGLAAGKGVIVASSSSEAETAVADLTTSRMAGVNGWPLVIEEALEGREASVLVFSDGRDYALMPAARDHKRIGENDTGPNTGGMGSVTASSILNKATMRQVRSEIIEPTLEAAHREGFPFKGVLFVGLMLTRDGPNVLEYNVRFGDPETQSILVRLNSNLLEIFEAVREGGLADMKIEWTEGASACVVLANRGYPGKYDSGAPIRGLPMSSLESPVQVFHAGTTRENGGDYIAAGGRVLGVTARGATLPEALKRCYRVVEDIKWDGMQYRRDIGKSNAG